MIIAISGKKGSGKDTTGKIIQILLGSPQLSNEGVKNFLEKKINNDTSYYPGEWQIKKFADKLKDIVCLLIGCTREQLEDEEFKSTVLGEHWNHYYINRKDKNIPPSFYGIYSTKEEVEIELKNFSSEYYCQKVDMTPRLMLQLIGTECGRKIIHPQIWVNSLMSEYKNINPLFSLEDGDALPVSLPEKYPNWIITDMRFPNEMRAVEDRNAVCIRINRFIYPNDPVNNQLHESEVALDNADFDYTIDNNGTIDELTEKVREILIKEKLLK